MMRSKNGTEYAIRLTPLVIARSLTTTGIVLNG